MYIYVDCIQFTKQNDVTSNTFLSQDTHFQKNSSTACADVKGRSVVYIYIYMYTYIYIYKCSLRSHEEMISNTYREKEDADTRADAYPHANMLTTCLSLPQHTRPYKTCIPTYKPANSTNPTNYQPITPAYPTNSTPLQPLRPYSPTTYKSTLHRKDRSSHIQTRFLTHIHTYI